MVDLKGMSADQLDILAAQAQNLSKALRAEQPSLILALQAGIIDDSYRTVRYGLIKSYKGQGEITLDNGSRWLAVGHSPTGGAEYVSREGYIEFIPIP